MKKLLFTLVGLLQAGCLLAAAPAHNAEKAVLRANVSDAKDAAPAIPIKPRRPWVLVAVHEEYMPQARIPERPQGKREPMPEIIRKDQ